VDEPGHVRDPGLGRQVRSGLAWSFANQLLGRVGTFATGVVLARILAPEDFGVYAVSFTAMLLLMAVNDVGLVQALIRRPGTLDDVGPTATTLIAGISVVLCAAFMGAAGPYASAMGAPDAAGVVRLMALALVIDGLGAVPTAALTRALAQARRTAADTMGFLVQAPLTIGLAVAGFGAWSLAVGHLAGNLVVTVAVVALAPVRYRPGWNPLVARRLLVEGAPLAATTLVGFGLLNLDYLVVGRALGPAQLGLYVLAFNLASWPVTVLITAIRNVSLAGFARLQHRLPELRAGFVRAMALTMALTLPVAALLGGFARPLIGFIYGSRWLPAAEPLRFLALLGAARVAYDLVWDLLVALGRSRLTLGINVVWLTLLAPALVAGAALGGITGVAAAHATVAVALIGPLYLVALTRATMPVRALSGHLLRPLAAAGAVVAVAVLTTALVDRPLPTLVIGGTVAGAASLALLAPTLRLSRAGARGEGLAAR
jgi:PST family polysaccharide transporter